MCDPAALAFYLLPDAADAATAEIAICDAAVCPTHINAARTWITDTVTQERRLVDTTRAAAAVCRFRHRGACEPTRAAVKALLGQ